MPKRVLIITFYWPPTSGSGVQRWLKFSKFLPNHDWQPVIYTPSNPDFGLRDNSLLDEIHPSVEVLKTEITDPSTVLHLFRKKGDENDGHSRLENKSLPFRIGRWIKGNFFIPDSRILWKQKSVRYLSNYLKENPIDVIVSTGPPHSMHLIAEALSAKFDIPWVMDIRDPLSNLISFRKASPTALAVNYYRKIESRLLKAADLVLATSPKMTETLRAFDHEKFVCIPNGYDPDDFPAESHSENSDKFILSYAGLLNKYRNAPALWSALELRLNKDQSFAAQFEFHIAGTVSEEVKSDLLHFPLLNERTTYLGFIEHMDVLKLYQRSDLLLLLNFHNIEQARGVIPGKLFEMLGSGKPILSLGPADSDYIPIVSHLDHFNHFEFDNDHGLIEYTTGLSKQELTLSGTSELKKFQRSAQAKELSNLLNRLSQC